MNTLFRWLTRHYRGSHIISWFLRKKLEQVPLRQLLGVNLASLAFALAIVVPQVDAINSELTVMRQTVETIVEVVPTVERFQWPLMRFGLTTRFSLGHPGIDMTAPKGTPVKPAAEGKVIWVQSFPFGYGKHLLVEHDKGAQSLYAHLSTVNVKEGQAIDKNTVVGEVGSTGWSTGNHLHLEIYQDGTPVNPLEVLPSIQSSAQ